ncbi:MAG TPA: tRNA (N(6)-L-threonylcarbamoyladenosine(37)-C(2))-methylthiotransferase MtaB [Mesotoga infera]|jgi:threonylcarbamoyladenosine tRNA methylthiotransferase MtaB|uniref:MiaB-like tRNA modifying enzyme n=1 Tax=Mesotoga infera TaxID=1236046 RepID=A0A117M941_9BACT|nr:MAG: MiaB-like tRNA modifying enzyme [Mesotoga infera]KUK91117.1 MAG: MiaB-like tRNA modifying enzyme [Mesotoga infera]HCO70123.1 tRNA (N(6)-L-threonylcarbamoyladenosine(37)-C(2))-methylthiotransferase MtaB [Mesotoga infera]
MKKTVSIYTFGCKMNQYESQAMAERLEDYEVSFSKEYADLFILNSCTVTSEAERKLRQLFRRLKGLNPNAKIIIAGCYSELSPEQLRSLGADEVIGVREKTAIHKFVSKHLNRPDGVEKGSFLTVTSSIEGRTRAFLGIEDGCLNRCSYCRIRLARGDKIISKPVDLVKREFRGLVERGYREIVLTGINIGYYGFDFDASLVELLYELEKIPGDWRIRLGSIDPDTMNDSFLELVANSSRMARHLHLSLQSGSDAVLRSMRRKYTISEYLRAVERAREIDSRFAFTTDLIAGFPGESDEDHRKTLRIIEDVGFLKVHVFRFSKRPGTEAAEMTGQIEPAVKKARSVELMEEAVRSRERYLEKQIGRMNRVLIERSDSSCSHGFDEYYIPHRIEGKHDGFVNAKITELQSHEEGSDAELYCRSVV